MGGEKGENGDAKIMEIDEPMAFKFEKNSAILSALQLLQDDFKPTVAYNFVKPEDVDERYRSEVKDKSKDTVVDRLGLLRTKLRRAFSTKREAMSFPKCLIEEDL